MSLPRYPEYKDSDVEWLGEVPEHWKVTRLKNIASINMGQSPSSDDCTQEEIGLPFLQGNADFGESCPLPRSYCAVANKLANVNDILFSVRAPVGAINIADQAYGIGRGLCAITPSPECSMRFVFHALQVMKSELFAVATGSTYEAVSTDQVGNATCLAPPLPEQTQIAAFLDREAAKIDELVAEQRRLMELLKEKRHAIISHAVTKGLNPHALMKPSGIEWLGDVPAHWEVWKLAHAFAQVGSGTTPKTDKHEYYDDGDIPWINTGDLNDGDLEDCEKRVTSLALADHSSLKIYPVGSVLIAMYGATIGKLAILRFPATVNQACCVFADSSQIETRFMFYLFLGLRKHILSLATGGGQPNVSQEILRSLRVAAPCHAEQKEVTDFLDREIGRIDTLTVEAQRAIDLLQERRTALISAAVTGQIDVRQLTEKQAA